eukprot:scaffold286531_cov22-Tisochrysis_lutea.AAC.1
MESREGLGVDLGLDGCVEADQGWYTAVEHSPHVLRRRGRLTRAGRRCTAKAHQHHECTLTHANTCREQCERHASELSAQRERQEQQC